MRAIAIREFGGVDKLRVEDLPCPQPSDDEVLIKIVFAGVNPVDWKIREGLLQKFFKHDFPLILGWDAAGTVAAIGKNVQDFQVGDSVFSYCRKEVVKEGAYAEFVAVEAKHVALKPKNIDFAQAASIPLVALTAWQSLFEHAMLKGGETILIQAGAGGVGSLAIEFARHSGAKIYTTASRENHDYVHRLGANIAIDYHKENFANKIRTFEPEGLDVVLDCVGGQPLQESYKLLRPGGRLVSIVERVDEKLAEQYKVKASYCFVAPNGAQLAEIARLLSSGRIKPPHIEEFPLEEAARAQERIRQGHTRGKIVLKVI